MISTPPVDHIREALRLVAAGDCDDHISREVREALTWAKREYLVEPATHRLTEKGERYWNIIDRSRSISLRPFEHVEEWIEWLSSLDPIAAIRIGALLTDGKTSQRLSKVIDEITYAQTTAGGGEMTRVELAETIGVSTAAVARRARRRLATREL